MRATREASGWKIDEPMPISMAASRMMGYVEARDIKRRPINVRLMPTVSEYGCGRRSVYKPTRGCSMEAVHWNARVIRPIWLKVRPWELLRMG